jgi:uncharacterized DUF497 family protein
MFDFIQGTGFDWDQGNSDKNWIRHQVTREECEQMFNNHPIVDSLNASQVEQRYHALGETDRARMLFVAFTFRGELIHVISARDMSRRERQTYERG